MRVLIIGLGSMGRRRARLLQKYSHSLQITGIDVQTERRKQAEKELGINTAESIDEALRNIKADMAFVSTPPLSHASVIRECLKKNLHVFTEINLSTIGYDDNLRLAEKKGKVLFLSSTFLYRKEIQYMKTAVRTCGCPLVYMYHAGQYLPDWHPWERYQSFFAGKKETNGCREFMAIEFPWIFDVFGEVKSVYSQRSRCSTLDISFPDTYQIMFEHESGHKGMLAFDIVSRKAVRNFEVSGENLYLAWDGTPEGLFQYDLDKKKEVQLLLYESVSKRSDYNASIIEDAYYSEIISFLDAVKGKGKAQYSFEKDKEVAAWMPTK